MAGRIADASDSDIVVEIPSDLSTAGAMSKDQEMNVYRIVQESLNNIVKLSGATRATIAIARRSAQEPDRYPVTPVTPVITVLIADDHPIFRTGLRQVIEADPAIRIVAEARDGNEALSTIESIRPDVAVLDINMPGRDGLEVARALRDRRSTTRVIFLTMHQDARFLNAALDAGVHGYVPKGQRRDRDRRRHQERARRAAVRQSGALERADRSQPARRRAREKSCRRSTR